MKRHQSPLWLDEKEQIRLMSMDTIQEMLQNVHIQFGGDYLLVLPFYQLFGENKWGLAVPHMISTFLSFYLLYLVCRSFYKSIWGYVVCFIVFSFNKTMIFHALEIRPYSVLIMLSLSGFLLIKHIFGHNVHSLPKIILINVGLFLTMAFHLFGTPILFFSYLFQISCHFLDQNHYKVIIDHLKKYIWSVLAGLCVIFYFVIRFSHERGGDWKHDPFQFVENGVVPILKMIFGNATGQKTLYPLLIGLPIAFLIPDKQQIKRILFFILLFILPVGCVYALCVTKHKWFIQRLFVWTMPWFAILLGWCWDTIAVFFKRLIASKRNQPPLSPSKQF
ncbi:MAG: hypothetical protein KC713_00725 [Candidatus Omnitrophica bacterium]|nr:hypothetical protein [Candidatus Omnitrophota bacterium]